jgi:Flp pilus assembly pilin Flp
MGGRQRAQDIVEYGMLLALIGLMVLLGAHAFGQQLAAWLSALAVRLTSA